MEKVYELAKKVKYFTLATVNEKGGPRVRTFQLIYVEDNKMYFGTGKHKEVFKQISENIVVGLNGCTSGGISLTIHGNIVIDESNNEAREKIFDKEPFIKELYEKNPESLIPVYIEHGKVNIFDLSVMPPVVENFEI